jgi:hypothetical protein
MKCRQTKVIAAGLENKIAVICMGLLISAWIPLFFAQQSLFAYAIGANTPASPTIPNKPIWKSLK